MNDSKAKIQESKKDEQIIKKEKRNSECTIKTCAEQLVSGAFCIQASSYYGGQFEGNSCMRLMEDSDQIFRDIKVHLLQRLFSGQ